MGPVAGGPMLGFGDLPSIPTSLIDFHGINDDTIPYDLEHSEGEQPQCCGAGASGIEIIFWIRIRIHSSGAKEFFWFFLKIVML